MPNSGFCLKVVLKIKELQGCNSDFSFREEGGNRVETSLFVEVGAVF